MATRDYEPSNDLDGFSAFSNRLRAIQWPATFKPTGIEKYDGESDPKTWLRTYSIAVRAARGDNDIMAANFPVMMGPKLTTGSKHFPLAPSTVGRISAASSSSTTRHIARVPRPDGIQCCAATR